MLDRQASAQHEGEETVAAGGGSTGIVIIAMAANFAIAVCKFLAYLGTSSSAMLSEAIHSLVDTSNQAVLLYGLKRAKRPPDAQHPFGYSKELYFWSFIVAILLFSLGAGVALYEGFEKLLHPHPVKNAYISYIVLIAAICIEGFSTYKALAEFNTRRGTAGMVSALQKSKDPALFAIVLEDVAAMTGLFCALIGIFIADKFGIAEADGIASIIIGLVLAMVAIFMSREIKALIVGEAASIEVQQGLRNIIKSETGQDKPIKAINEISTMHLGPEDVLVAASVDFHDGQTTQVVEMVTSRLEDKVRAEYPEVRRLFLEVINTKDHKRIEQENALLSGNAKPEPDKRGAGGTAHHAASKDGAANSKPGPSRKQRKKARKNKRK